MATGKDHEAAPSLLSLRQEARAIYGSDAAGYDAGRPDYPAEVYEILAARCGLRAGASVVEIGPGTGLVTRRLVAAGARVVAVEPDQNMAVHLAAAVSSDVEIIPGTFEQAPLRHDKFDLAVAATSFHWVDQGNRAAARMPPRGGRGTPTRPPSRRPASTCSSRPKSGTCCRST